MRRRIVGRGFEGVELPQVRGWRPVGGEDVELLQGGELPRRRLVSQVPGRSEGPAAFGQPFGGRALLDETQGQNLGRSTNVTLATVFPVGANILNLSGDDAQARVMTVSLFAELVSPAAGDRIIDLYALVSWGSGGVQYTAEIDFTTGSVFQISASSLRIDVRGSGIGTAKAMAHVGYGAAGEKSAQRTVVGGALAVGATSTSTQIPNFADEMQLHRSPATANLTVQFQTRTGGVLSEFLVGNGPGDGSELFKIPEGATRVVIVNGLGAALLTYRTVFGLCL